MRFILVIESENEGVENREDVACLVANASKAFATERDTYLIRDINGNRVGSFKYEGDEIGRCESYYEGEQCLKDRHGVDDPHVSPHANW